MTATAPVSVERDLRRILAVQALRAFAYGFASVILGTSLAAGGLSDARVGLVFTAMLAGNAIISIAVGTVGDRVGRRRLYALLLAAMGLAGAVYAFSASFTVLALVALSGTLSTDPNESGPITSLEQAMMGSAPPALRTRVFGRYNAVAYLAGAMGALAAGGPALLRRSIPHLLADQRWLLLFPVVAVACVVLATRLSPGVESERPAAHPLERSRSNVAKLAALFGLDAFAGGFIVATFVAFWFSRKFHTSAEVIAAILFGMGLLQAASAIVSGRLAGRIGMLNTMVFTHLPSNLMLMAVPFMPTLGSAVAMLLLRSTLSQMDVPARQAFVVSIVDPEERTAAAAYTNTARYLVRPFGAASAGLVMQRIAVGAPFVIAGALKSVYDVALYLSFRRVRLPEEGGREVTPPRPAR